MTQKEEVLNYLMENSSMTRIEAMTELHILNVTARIADLRKEGYNIKATLIHTKNKYGRKVSYAKWSLEK